MTVEEIQTLQLQPQRYCPTVSVRAIGDDSRTLTFVFATERLALDDGVVMADGMDASRFLTNPTFYGDHWTSVENKLGTVTAIRRTETGWEGDFKFAPPEVSEDADDAYRFLAWAGHGATSIGFIPTKVRRGSELRPDEIIKYGSKLRWVADEWQLLEISIVGVGADPGAVMLKGGAPARALRSALAYTTLDAWKRSEEAAATATATTPRDGEPCTIDTGDGEGDPEPIIDHAAMHAESMAVMNSIADSMRQMCGKLDQAIGAKGAEKSANVETKRKVFDWSKLESFPAPK